VSTTLNHPARLDNEYLISAPNRGEPVCNYEVVRPRIKYRNPSWISASIPNPTLDVASSRI